MLRKCFHSYFFLLHKSTTLKPSRIHHFISHLSQNWGLGRSVHREKQIPCGNSKGLLQIWSWLWQVVEVVLFSRRQKRFSLGFLQQLTADQWEMLDANGVECMNLAGVKSSYMYNGFTTTFTILVSTFHAGVQVSRKCMLFFACEPVLCEKGIFWIVHPTITSAAEDQLCELQ